MNIRWFVNNDGRTSLQSRDDYGNWFDVPTVTAEQERIMEEEHEKRIKEENEKYEKALKGKYYTIR